MKKSRRMLTHHPIKIYAILRWMISALLATGFAISGLLFIFQHVFTFGLSLIVTFLAFAVVTVLIYRVNARYLLPKLERLPRAARWAVLAFAVISGLFLVIGAPGGLLSDSIAKLNLQNPYIRRLLVREATLTISANGDRNANSNDAAVELLYMTTDYGDISFLAFEYQGEWERRSDSLFTSAESPASIVWRGRPGGHATLVFRSSPDAGVVSISGDGISQQIDLYSPAEKEVVFDLELPVRSQLAVQFILISILSLTAGFLLLVLLVALPVNDQQHATQQVVVSLFFVVYLIIGAWVYQDYGIPTDENTQRRHGLVSAKFIIHKLDPGYDSQLFEGLPDLDTYKSKNYGVALNLPMALVEVFTDFSDTRDLYLFRHYTIFLFFFLGTVAFFKMGGEKFNDWRIGLLGAAIFILTPRIFADSFFNVKDTTFLAAFTISLYFGFRFWRNPTYASAIFFGISAAFATNIRVITIMMVALVLVYALIHREPPFRKAWSSYAVLVAAYCGFLVLYFPASWSNPVRTVGETLLVFSDFERFTGTTLFRGVSIPGQNVPPEYLPVWIAITTPMLYLFSFIAGSIAACIHGYNALRQRRDPIIHEDLVFLALAIVPVLAAIVLGSTLYNGWRHFFFIHAPFVVVVLVGFDFLFQTLSSVSKPRLRQAGLLLFTLWVGGTLVNNARWMTVNHPHQNVFYNPILVQVFGGREGFDRDYWGLSIRQGLEYLLAKDSCDSITVRIDGDAQTRGWILTKNQRMRIVYTDDPQQMVDYYIGIYSVRNKQYPYDPSYSIRVDGLPILTIYANPNRNDCR